MQFSFLTANDSSGTGLNVSNIYVFIPFAFKHSAAYSLNSFDIFLESYAIATPFSCAFSFIIKLANPWVAFVTVYLFILLVPAPITPLSPAVPNSKLL